MIDIRFEELNIDRYKQMIEWCNEHFGRAAIWASQLDKPAGVATWYSNNNYDKNKFTGDKMETGRARFSFKTDQEATLFSLRWSEKT